MEKIREQMNKETLQKICTIAKIKLDDAEMLKFTRQFDEIFAFFSTITAMKMSESAQEFPTENYLREDEMAPFGDTDAIINEFPKKKDRLSIVPRNL